MFKSIVKMNFHHNILSKWTSLHYFFFINFIFMKLVRHNKMILNIWFINIWCEMASNNLLISSPKMTRRWIFYFALSNHLFFEMIKFFFFLYFKNLFWINTIYFYFQLWSFLELLEIWLSFQCLLASKSL